MLKLGFAEVDHFKNFLVEGFVKLFLVAAEFLNDVVEMGETFLYVCFELVCFGDICGWITRNSLPFAAVFFKDHADSLFEFF